MSIYELSDLDLQNVGGGDFSVNKDGSYCLDITEAETLRNKGYVVEAVFDDSGTTRTGYIVLKTTDSGRYKEAGEKEVRSILRQTKI